MKLIFAIVNSDDAAAVTQSLSKEGFSSTRMATTGGFLKMGNTTILVGVDAGHRHHQGGVPVPKSRHPHLHGYPLRRLHGRHPHPGHRWRRHHLRGGRGPVRARLR